MLEDALAITFSVCLFSYLGLKDKCLSMYDKIMPKSGYMISLFRELISCVKCISFWSVLVFSVLCGYGIVRCILVSLMCAFLSLWIDLLLMYINKIYDKLWEDI